MLKCESCEGNKTTENMGESSADKCICKFNSFSVKFGYTDGVKSSLIHIVCVQMTYLNCT